MILNLDTYFNPFPIEKSIEFNFFTFSGGEPHIKIISDLSGVNKVTITQRIQSFNDVGVILVTVNALRNLGIEKIDLFIPYFPGARQDRIMQEGEALTVKVYTDLINGLNLNSVTIFDAHSEVTLALLNNVKEVTNHQFIKKVLTDFPDDTLLIAPDAGALKKIYKLASHLKDYDVIECSKVRNIATRELSNFKVYADDLKGKDCLIVDDICDGGRTFIGLAKELKKKNAGKLYLAISHGIFNRGLDELNKYFDKIYTTNSFKDIIIEKNIVQINMNEFL